MRIQSFQEMLLEYGVIDLPSDNKEERDEILSKYQYSVIVEGEHTEFDNLNKWIRLNIGENSVKFLYFGKTGYDFGFAEYFFYKEEYVKKITRAIPNIYTIYPNSSRPNHTCKSEGYSVSIDYESTNKDAIVYPAD